MAGLALSGGEAWGGGGIGREEVGGSDAEKGENLGECEVECESGVQI